MDRTSRAYLAALVGALAFVALLAILTMASGHASAKTVTLTSDASGKENLVANAIATASDGDIIALKGGFFYEGNLTIAKGLTFVGDDKSVLLADSIHVTAKNVTFHTITMSLNSGVLRIDADHWTFDQVSLRQCAGYTCVRVEKGNWGVISNSSFEGLVSDAVDINGSRDIRVSDVLILAPYADFKVNLTSNISFWNVKFTEAEIGMYVSFCNNLTVDHSVFDTYGWGVLAANSTNLTVKGSLIMSNMAYLTNYGVYVTGGKTVNILNNTFMGDAAGVAVYKCSQVLVKWNSIYNNLEGVWSWVSDGTVTGNAIFSNIRYGVNASGNGLTAKGNYWGTTSVSVALSMVRGTGNIEPIENSDPTPASVPLMVNPIPPITNGTEDQIAVTLLEVGPYFYDPTWYVQAWSPNPSSVRFLVVYNSDPKNVTIQISETGTCAGTCKNAEGQLKASTALHWYGTVNIRLRATNWRGRYVDTNTFPIHFRHIISLPVVDIKGTPKTTVRDLHIGQEWQLNITVYDDSTSDRIEYRIDNGPWQVISQSAACAIDNSTKSKGMPLCAKTVLHLKVTENMGVGLHNVSIRACNGGHCSDETDTGKYMIQLNDTGSPGKDFSPTGVALALVLLVLIALVLVAMSTSKKEKPRPEEDDTVSESGDEEE
jgi:nitrous oxidase accessory protein NosD